MGTIIGGKTCTWQQLLMSLQKKITPLKRYDGEIRCVPGLLKSPNLSTICPNFAFYRNFMYAAIAKIQYGLYGIRRYDVSSKN